MKRSIKILVVILSLFPALLLAQTTITVNSSADDANNTGNCTLREAIEAANTNTAVDSCPAGQSTGTDLIHFAIPGSGPHLIQPGSEFSPLTESVTIDGSTQAGFAGSPVIRLDGSGGLQFYALRLHADNITVNALSVTGFSNALEVGSAASGSIIATGSVITGSWIGLSPDGSPVGNQHGIEITSSSSNSMIGGDTVALRNVISGNSHNGVFCAFSADNTVAGNYIGTNPAGTLAVGNNQAGVYANACPGLDLRNNVISGNNNDGVILVGSPASLVRVRANRIGTDVTGSLAIPNTMNGVYIFGPGNNPATNVQIGGTAASDANVISGNTRTGIILEQTSGIIVEGNKVGTSSSGTVPVGNGQNGITVYGEKASNNRFGGPTAAQGNVISGNQELGIYLAEGRFALVQNNLIGPDVTGFSGVGNGSIGVLILGAARSSILNNVISGNGLPGKNSREGLRIINADSTIVQGNKIGTDILGSGNLKNDRLGVLIANGADYTLFGGSGPGEGNIVAFNGVAGLFVDDDVVGNRIQRNSFFLNGDIGIDLGSNGQSANDPGDADTGPNNLQNFPTITQAHYRTATSELEISYLVATDPANATYPILVEFYLADPVHREGMSYLGEQLYNTADAGITRLFQVPTGPSSGYVVATATDAMGNTSEFTYPAREIRDTATLSMLTVDTLVDDETLNGNCTLREAIIAANTNTTVDGCVAGSASETDVIHFNLSGVTPYLLQPESELPAITGPTHIDGSTQPGYLGVPLVVLNGTFAGFSRGLVLSGSDITVSGLSITSFSRAGIFVGVTPPAAPGNNVRVISSYLGLSPTGSRSGNQYGIQSAFASNLVIGGPSVAERNVISANSSGGILLTDTNGCTVVNNYVGTDVSGNAERGNSTGGIALVEASDCTLSDNLVSGNLGYGISVGHYAGSLNRITNNLIGTNATGNAAVANSGVGLLISGEQTPPTTANIISNNTISGNGSDGVQLINAKDQTLTNNKVGTDLNGTLAIANGNDGIYLAGSLSTNNKIGTPGNGNLTSGNTRSGIFISSGVPGVEIESNRIGTNLTGTAAIPNLEFGVVVEQADQVRIQNNLISGNGGPSSSNGDGVFLNQSIGTTVSKNIIGADVSSLTALGNRQNGVLIVNAFLGTTIGGETADLGNTIAFNGSAGVAIQGGLAAKNQVRNNRFFQNSGIGIDLGSVGVNMNDTGDADSGANQLQNFPVVQTATFASSNSTLEIDYSVPSTPVNSAYPIVIEFYLTDVHQEEGKTFIGVDSYPLASAGLSKVVTFNVPGGTAGFLVAVATDANGNTSEFSSPATGIQDATDNEHEGIPGEYVLEPSFPNPFSSHATFRFTAPSDQIVSVALYNTLGQKVGSLFDGFVPAGKVQNVEINGTSLPSGVYLLRLEAANRLYTERVVHRN